MSKSETVGKENVKTYDIRDFGAVGNGTTSNTKAINQAIIEASEGMTNGIMNRAIVEISDGIWLTGPIIMRSNVELHLSDNAVILFDKNPEEFPLIVTDYEGIERIRTMSPIFAENAENIAITGKGKIEGSGHLWRPVKEFKMTKKQWAKLLEESPYVVDSKEGGVWMPSKSAYDGRGQGELYPEDENALEKAAPFYDFYRPVMLNFKHCKNVLLQNVTIQNSPAWAVHLYFCEEVKVQEITVLNPYHAQNGDGIDIESCKNVEVAYSRFQVGDDGICIKSGKNAKARAIKGPSENIHIHHCYVGQSHGGFVVGSEMSRGVRNVLVEDCTFIDADVGVRFKSALGRGGVVEDIQIRRINMVNIKEEAFIFTMDYVHNIMDYIVEDELNSDDSDIPYFRNIEISDCNCINAKIGVRVKGLEGRTDTISDIRFINCNIVAKNADKLDNCAKIVLS